MQIERQTEKALLVIHDGITFWIQKRWMKKDGSLTNAGWKAFHIAQRSHCQHIGFDALKEFEVKQEAKKAVLLRCVAESPGGKKTNVEFWVPHSMTNNWNFVANKVRELEAGFPFIGTRIIWNGSEGGNYVR